METLSSIILVVSIIIGKPPFIIIEMENILLTNVVLQVLTQMLKELPLL